MEDTAQGGGEHGHAGSDSEATFDRLRERAATLDGCQTARAVREKLAHIVHDELNVDVVGVYRREGDRYRAAVRAGESDAVRIPEVLSGEHSPVATVVEAGGTHCGSIAEDAFDDATDYCVTPLNGDGAVLVLSADPDGTSTETTGALSMIAGYAENALAEVEGGTLRRAATGDVRPDVSEDVLLEALSHAFPDYAYIFDDDGTYLDVLLGIRTIQLQPRDELVGRSVHDVLAEESANRIVSAVRTATGTGDVQRVEYSTDGETGKSHYEGRVAPLPGVEDRCSRAVLVARDVTDRHERERDLRRQNERLEEFASIVSHDLRNPLNTASGFLELLADDIDDDRLERIGTAHDRMESLIEDLLTLARNGRAVTDPTLIDLATAAEQAWETVSSNGTLVVDGTVTIRADPNRVRQVLENLLRNASEHAAPNPTVRVGPLPESDGFYVADDGDGIPADEREEVFETGYTSIPGGTGLGLAIVERVVEAHDWTVEVREGADSGARFEFRGVETVTADSDG